MNLAPPLRRTLARSAAAGFVLVDAALVQARGAPIDIRIVTSAPSDTTLDAYAHGRDRLAAGDVAAALSAFRQALAADPQSIGALNGIAVCYDRMGQYDISHTYYALALALDPHSPTVLNNYGYSLYLQGDHAAALAPLRAAAASSDAEAASASRRTLALIAGATARGPAPYPGDDPDGPRIVQTSDGEQRLITRPPASAMVAALGADAALTAAATPWSDQDDARLTADEHRPDVAAALAAAIAAPHPVVAPAGPDFTAVALAQVPATSAGTRLDTNLRLEATLPPGLRDADDDQGAQHWLAALPGGSNPRAPARRPLSGLAPPAPERPGFDSDDHELNRFAALVQGDEAALRAAAIQRLQQLRQRLAAA